jgi:outer membrane protein insertion porin family
LASSTVSHDTRDFVLDPRKGAYRDIRAELAGGPLGGDNDFYTLNGTMQRYLPTRGRSVFAVRLRAAFADAYGDSEDLGVPVENRYFTGGGNSVRGYRENSLGPRAFAEEGSGELTETVVGGRFLLLGNAEIRFPVPFFSRYRFSASAFVDCGNVWPSLRSVDLKDFRLRAGREEVNDQDFRYSAGVGLRYNTPIGPIRLDYGMPLKKDESDRFGRFHLSLGQIF